MFILDVVHHLNVSHLDVSVILIAKNIGTAVGFNNMAVIFGV